MLYRGLKTLDKLDIAEEKERLEKERQKESEAPIAFTMLSGLESSVLDPLVLDPL